jgi:hypothetical protein
MEWTDLNISINGETIDTKPVNYNHKDVTIIQATFIGKNSLGYIHNNRYTLILEPKSYKIKRIDGTGICPYQSIRAFVINWKDIVIV